MTTKADQTYAMMPAALVVRPRRVEDSNATQAPGATFDGGVELKRCDRDIEDINDDLASLTDDGQRPTKSRRVLDRGDLACRRDRRPPSTTSKWGDGVSDDRSSRPGKDDEEVDSVASPSRQPLDDVDSAQGVSHIDDDAENVDDVRTER